jgi:putative pyoverdin transport system ATP-binding/permease protein
MSTDFAGGLFSLLTRHRPVRVFISLLLGALGGIAYGLIIPLLLMSIYGTQDVFPMPEQEGVYRIAGFEISNPRLALAFFGLCFFLLLVRTVSQILFVQVVISATAQLRLQLCERVGLMSIKCLEQIGQPVLIGALTGDIPRVTGGAATLPQFFFGLSSVIGMLGFLIFVNVRAFVLVVGAILTSVAIYRMLAFFGGRHLMQARQVGDRIQKGVEGLIRGAKELKLNSARRSAFMQEDLVAQEVLSVRHQMIGNAFMILGTSYGSIAAFLAMGLFVYILAGHYALPPAETAAAIMAMLYATGPVASITNSITPYIMGQVSLRKLRELSVQMTPEPLGSERVPPFHQLRLTGITYRYSGDDVFSVGPVDLTLQEGEVTYIIGGNGSGKSTLAKMISCHYRPDGGEFLMGATAVSDSNIESARQYVAATYTDFHLFVRLFGISPPRIQQANYYLERLGLAGKVSVTNEQFSTLALSDGQRKRLALLVATLEERKVYVFDEWAADQDPEFKAFFYGPFLQEMRREGKIIVVITHDDRYFHGADQIVKMEGGKVIAVQRPEAERTSS